MDIRKIPGQIPTPVDLDRFDECPGPYCMSFGFDIQPIISSIETVGLINAPFVKRGKDGHFDVVAGYRRIKALRILGRSMVPCMDLSESGLSPLDMFCLNLHDNLTVRKFNNVEKGMIINRLSLYLPEEEIRKRYLQILDISNPKDLDLLRKIEGLSEVTKSSVADGTLSLNTIRQILEMDHPSGEAIVQWILNLKLNFNQQLKFIEYINDISIKENKSIARLLAENHFMMTSGENRLNTPQKAKRTLALLRARRMPYLAQSERTFERFIANLNLPDGVRILHPPFFESQGYRLEMAFTDGEDLKKKIKDLEQKKEIEMIGDPWKECHEPV